MAKKRAASKVGNRGQETTGQVSIKTLEDLVEEVEELLVMAKRACQRMTVLSKNGSPVVTALKVASRKRGNLAYRAYLDGLAAGMLEASEDMSGTVRLPESNG